MIVLSIFKFDAYWFIDFIARILIKKFSGLKTYFLSFSFIKIQDQDICRTWWLYLCKLGISLVTRTRLLHWFNDGSDDTALLPLLLLKIRFQSSVRMLGTIVCSGPSVWLFSPARDAVKVTLEFGFICPFVGIDPTDWGATTAVAPGQIIDSFLPILDT